MYLLTTLGSFLLVSASYSLSAVLVPTNGYKNSHCSGSFMAQTEIVTCFSPVPITEDEVPKIENQVLLVCIGNGLLIEHQFACKRKLTVTQKVSV